jgi:hypothetical protein
MIGGRGVEGSRVGAWVEVVNPAEIGTPGVLVGKMDVAFGKVNELVAVGDSPMPPPWSREGKLQPRRKTSRINAINRWRRGLA